MKSLMLCIALLVPKAASCNPKKICPECYRYYCMAKCGTPDCVQCWEHPRRFRPDFNRDTFLTADTDGNACLTWDGIIGLFLLLLPPAFPKDHGHLGLGENFGLFSRADVDQSGC